MKMLLRETVKTLRLFCKKQKHEFMNDRFHLPPRGMDENLWRERRDISGRKYFLWKKQH